MCCKMSGIEEVAGDGLQEIGDWAGWSAVEAMD